MFTNVLLAILIFLGFAFGSIVLKKPSRPLIQCESYHVKQCVKEGKCKPTIEECSVESEKPPSCYVLWTADNVTGEVNLTMKGCFTDSVECNQTECISSSALKNNMFFCCCKGSLCNTEHKWIPTTTSATEIEVPKENVANDNTLYVTIACLVLTALIVFLVGGLLFYRKRKQAMFNEIPTIEPEVTSSSPCIALRPIQLVEMKARGRFGAVWHGRMKNDDYAVKIFPVQEKDSWTTEQEIYKLPRMKHPNILEFIGAEKHMEKMQPEFWLITAYHTYGSLCDYLKAHTISWLELCKIAESMARGLMHLHEEIGASKTDGLKPAIAHRDFKSKNVLLKSDLTACIADFGLAMIFQPGKPCGDTHGQVGTRRYMAPEVLEGAINFTRDAFLRIDVYACGLVLWEMVSRCDAHTGVVNEYTLPFETELGLHPSLDQMQENVVMKKLRPTIYEHWRAHPGLSQICDTIEECWDHDAEARLSSSCVMERVSQHTKYPTAPLLIEANTDASNNI